MGKNPFKPLLNGLEVSTLFKALDSIPARLVGGCVRDALLGIQSPDIDVAVAVPPQKVIELLTDNHIKVVPTGINFGTVTAVINHQSFEITSLREDIQTDGRHAKVIFGTDWLKDAERRDFTINALYLDNQGILYDYFNGLGDLEKGKITFIGEPAQRIREDYLRILRYYRFMAYFGKGEPLTIPALKELCLGLKQLSTERIQTELLKLLMANEPEKALNAMVSDNIFETLYDHPVNLEGLFKVLKVERSLGIPPKALRRLFALFYSIPNGFQDMDSKIRSEHRNVDNYLRAKPLLMVLRASEIFDSTHPGQISKSEGYIAAEIPSFYDSHFRFSHHKKTFLANMQKYLSHSDKRWTLYNQGHDFFYDWRLLHFSLLEEFSEENLGKLKQDLEWGASQSPLKFPLTGKDLLKQGLSPGPKVGELLATCEKWWVENDFKPTKQECLDFFITQNQD